MLRVLKHTDPTPGKDIRLHLDLHGELQLCAGLYERETHADLQRLLRGCCAAADLGAAKGDLTIHFLRQPGMRRVVAVEPLASEREQLAANLELNGLAGDPRQRPGRGLSCAQGGQGRTD